MSPAEQTQELPVVTALDGRIINVEHQLLFDGRPVHSPELIAWVLRPGMWATWIRGVFGPGEDVRTDVQVIEQTVPGWVTVRAHVLDFAGSAIGYPPRPGSLYVAEASDTPTALINFPLRDDVAKQVANWWGWRPSMMTLALRRT
jgi:hypothetical protein